MIADPNNAAHKIERSGGLAGGGAPANRSKPKAPADPPFLIASELEADLARLTALVAARRDDAELTAQAPKLRRAIDAIDRALGEPTRRDRGPALPAPLIHCADTGTTRVEIARTALQRAIAALPHRKRSRKGRIDPDTWLMFQVLDGRLHVRGVQLRTLAKKDASGKMGHTASPLVGSVFVAARGTCGARRQWTVPAGPLRGWLAAADEPSIWMTVGDDEVTLTSKGFDAPFPTLPEHSESDFAGILEAANVTAVVPARPLLAALNCTRRFVGPSGRAGAYQPVVTAMDGVLHADVPYAAARVQVDGLGDSKMCIHRNDLARVARFLRSCRDGQVEIREADKWVFLVRKSDNAVLGVTAACGTIRKIEADLPSEDRSVWVFKRDEALRGIGILHAGAAWEDNRIFLGKEDDKVVLSAVAVTGNMITFGVDAPNDLGEAAPLDVPQPRILVDRRWLGAALRSSNQEVVRIGVTPANRGGYLRLRERIPGARFDVHIAWQGNRRA